MFIKYGVMSIDNLVNDFLIWDSFYFVGCFQKLVKIFWDYFCVWFVN